MKISPAMNKLAISLLFLVLSLLLPQNAKFVPLEDLRGNIAGLMRQGANLLEPKSEPALQAAIEKISNEYLVRLAQIKSEATALRAEALELLEAARSRRKP